MSSRRRMLQNGRKYRVRGQTLEDRGGDYPRLPEGKPDPAWSRWPAPLRSHAQALYDDWILRG